MNLKNIFILMLCFLLLVSLFGCNNIDNEKNLQEKTYSELDYLEKKIISMVSSLKNIKLDSYQINTKTIEVDKEEEQESNNENKEKVTVSEMNSTSMFNGNDEIDWKNLEFEIENFYNIWTTVILDLYKVNINNEEILKFSNLLDETAINIKNKEEQLTINSLSNLYNLIPSYLKSFNKDERKNNIIETKMYVLQAFVAKEQDNWGEVQNKLNQAIGIFTEIVNNLENSKEKEYNINKTYIALQELKSSSLYNDKDVFNIKYRNFLEEISIL